MMLLLMTVLHFQKKNCFLCSKECHSNHVRIVCTVCKLNVHKRCAKNVANNCGINTKDMAKVLQELGISGDKFSTASKRKKARVPVLQFVGDVCLLSDVTVPQVPWKNSCNKSSGNITALLLV